MASATVECIVELFAIFRAGAIACLFNPKWPEKRIKTLTQRIECGTLNPQSAICNPQSPDRPATIVFTSGSGGEPKAALHSLGNHYANALASNRNIAVHPGDRWLLSLPLYHVAGIGILFRCFAGGAAVALPREGESIDAAVRRAGVTHVSLVATQLHRLLRDARAVKALRGLKAILLGGSAIPESLVRAAFAHGLPIHTSYGLTEMASQVTTTRPGAGLDALLTSGEPLEPERVAIASDGEILVRGKSLFLGYVGKYGDASLFSAPLPGKMEKQKIGKRPHISWFHTGDLGRFDGAGRLIVSGRKDNMFVCGGENVQPEEVEACLCRHPRVANAVVVPAADAEFVSVPVAFVQCEGGAIPHDELVRHLESELPRHKIPRRFLPWPETESSASMKVDRKRFAELVR